MFVEDVVGAAARRAISKAPQMVAATNLVSCSTHTPSIAIPMTISEKLSHRRQIAVASSIVHCLVNPIPNPRAHPPYFSRWPGSASRLSNRFEAFLFDLLIAGPVMKAWIL